MVCLVNKELLYWLVVVVPRGQTGEQIQQDQDMARMARMADLQVVLNMRIGNEIPSLLTLPNVLSCLRHIQV